MQIIGQNYHFEIYSSVVEKIKEKVEKRVKQRYLQKISSIGVDPALIESKHFEPVNPIVYHQWNQSTFYFTWFWKQACTRNNNLKPSAAYKPIIKWFQGLSKEPSYFTIRFK